MATRRSEQWVTAADAPAENATEISPKAARTLLTRAVNLLSRRDYSRAELGKKLLLPTLYQQKQRLKLEFLSKNQQNNTATTGHISDEINLLTSNESKAFVPPTSAEIDTVLDTLSKLGYLDDTRFAASLVRRKSIRAGTARVMQTLSQHALPSDQLAVIASDLKSTELERCYITWAQRYAHKINDDESLDCKPQDYNTQQLAKAKQMRYLVGRGFSGDAVRRVLNGWKPDE